MIDAITLFLKVHPQVSFKGLVGWDFKYHQDPHPADARVNYTQESYDKLYCTDILKLRSLRVCAKNSVNAQLCQMFIITVFQLAGIFQNAHLKKKNFQTAFYFDNI